MKNNTPEKLRPFIFHGVDLDFGSGDVAEGTCPLCDKENHFFVKKSTGQWNCKRCGESGNVPTFLSALLEAGRKATTDKALKSLADDRKVPFDELKEWDVVVHPLRHGEWLLPGFNEKRKLSNLFRICQDGDGWKALPTATCKLHPFRCPKDFTRKKIQKVMVAEGPWDGIALRAALKKVAKRGNRFARTNDPKASLFSMVNVLAVPGAGTFNVDWVQYLAGTDATFLYDNDHPKKQKTGRKMRPGWDGMQRAIKTCGKAKKAPKSLSTLRWGKDGHNMDLPNGYDLRDLIADKEPKAAIEFVIKSSRRVKLETLASLDTGPTLEPIHREKFADLCKDFDDNLHFHPNMKDTLAVMLSVVTSTTLYGDQIWFRVIGPPGSGKTTLAECVTAAKDFIIGRSVLTGFHSGFTAGDGGSKRTASLIPRLKGKTLIVKDADTVVNSPSRDRILSELRDIYDGTSRAEYRNRQIEEHTGIQATFILCGTDELRALNRTFLGERFLDCEILGDESQTPFLERAIENTYDKILGSLKPPEEEQTDHEVHGEARTEFLQRATMGFIYHLKAGLEAGTVVGPGYPDAMKKRVSALGNVLASVRAKVRRDRDELLYRPRKELGTRLVSQLTKLAVCLAIVLGKKNVDREVLRILQKVVKDTGEGFQMEITGLLARNKNGLTTKQIALTLGLAETSVGRVLKDMQELALIEREDRPNRSGIRGRNAHYFILSVELRTQWETAFGKVKK